MEKWHGTGRREEVLLDKIARVGARMHSESEGVFQGEVKKGEKLAEWAGLVPRDNAPDQTASVVV